jgi:hypothetical protein
VFALKPDSTFNIQKFVTIQLVLIPKNQNLRKSSLSADFADDADFKTRIQV